MNEYDFFPNSSTLDRAARDLEAAQARLNQLKMQIQQNRLEMAHLEQAVKEAEGEYDQAYQEYRAVSENEPGIASRM